MGQFDEKDIKDIQRGYLGMELLRFTTAGSVDDGKSTLIGRLLYDTKQIFEDQLEAVKQASLKTGSETVNLALLTDGLKAEREQGITIDVAYRYFATPKRKFIIADTPGHVQYTRNMVTGASTANLAIVLVDARHGILEQTIRHAYIASLLQIPHLVICINKMDLVDYKQEVFEDIKRDFNQLAAKLDVQDIRFVPISALNGDNVVDRSEVMTWYEGPTLLHILENVHIASDINHIDFRFPVQYVIRPQRDEYHDYRAYAGRLASGIIRKGDTVKVLPSGFTSKVKTIDFFGEELDYAFAPQSVQITLEDDIDISRGDMIVRENNVPIVSQDIDLMVCWLGNEKMNLGGKYAIKQTSKDARCMIKELQYKVDINTMERISDGNSLEMNEIGKVTIRTTSPLFFDSYRQNRQTGSLILIDEATNVTVGAGMIVGVHK
jgi:sulfate adenylyltransferase subunit 1